MADLHLNIISPEASLFDGDIEKVTVPGELGRFTILPHHAPIISSLVKGVIEYIPVADGANGADVTDKEAGGKKSLDIEGGFIEMSDGIVTICVS